MTVTLPVLAVCPAGMVRRLFWLSVKSSAVAGETGSASTTRVTSLAVGPLRLAVTVERLAPSSAFSKMRGGLRSRLATDTSSSLIGIVQLSCKPSSPGPTQ